MKYTYEFEQADERKFRQILSRLDDDEYSVIEEITSVIEEKNPRSTMKRMVIEMEPEACLTIKLGMKQVRIKGGLTDEEAAARKALEEHHTIKVRVKVNGCGAVESVTADRPPTDTP